MRGMKTSRITGGGLLLALGALTLAPVSAWAASLTVGSANGAAGTSVTFSVTLNTEGASVNGVQNDLGFDATNTPIGVRTAGNCSVTTTQACSTDNDCPDLQAPFTGKEPCVNVTSAPDCTVNSSIGKGGFFSFLPTGCSGASCTGLRAVIIALDNTDAIATGKALYSCKVNIAAGAADQAYPLTVSNTVASDTAFQPVCGAGSAPQCGGTDGAVNVGAGACACDCDGNGRVTGTEVTKCVQILGASRPLSDCPAADSDHNGRVTGTDVTRGVLALGAGTSCIPQ